MVPRRQEGPCTSFPKSAPRQAVPALQLRLALGNPRLTTRRARLLGSAALGPSEASPLPSQLPGDLPLGSSLSPLPSLRESLFLTPTRPLGLAFYKMDLSFYKRQKEPLARAALAFCPGGKIPEAKALQRAG